MPVPSPAIAAILAAHVERWHGRLPVFPGGAFDERASIVELPARVAAIYPPIPQAKLDALTVALGLYSDAIVAVDNVMDFVRERPEETRRLPRVGALFAQAYRTFAELLGGAPHFWTRLERYTIEYIDAMDGEVRYASGAAPWEACSDAECLQIARGKNGLVRLVDASVAALAGCDRADDGAAEILLDAFVASQMLDDVRDWREDLRDGALSLLLLRAARTKPTPADAKALGPALYLDGHVASVLALADEHAARAIAGAEALGATAIVRATTTFREQLTALRGRVEREVSALRVASAR